MLAALGKIIPKDALGNTVSYNDTSHCRATGIYSRGTGDGEQILIDWKVVCL